MAGQKNEDCFEAKHFFLILMITVGTQVIIILLI